MILNILEKIKEDEPIFVITKLGEKFEVEVIDFKNKYILMKNYKMYNKSTIAFEDIVNWE